MISFLKKILNCYDKIILSIFKLHGYSPKLESNPELDKLYNGWMGFIIVYTVGLVWGSAEMSLLTCTMNLLTIGSWIIEQIIAIKRLKFAGTDSRLQLIRNSMIWSQIFYGILLSALFSLSIINWYGGNIVAITTYLIILGGSNLLVMGEQIVSSKYEMDI